MFSTLWPRRSRTWSHSVAVPMQIPGVRIWQRLPSRRITSARFRWYSLPSVTRRVEPCQFPEATWMPPGNEVGLVREVGLHAVPLRCPTGVGELLGDRKSTRLNSSHLVISYAV